MMRRLFVGFALLASLSVAAPAEAITNGGPDGNQHPNVGGLVAPTPFPDGTSIYCSAGQEGMKSYAKANNIDVLWNSANMDVGTQASQIDEFISQKVNAIIVIPVQADSLGPQVKKANDAKIPIIDVNAALNSDQLSGSVQPDDVAAGAGEMEMMAKAMGGKGNIVLLQGPLGGSGEINRGKGITQVLAKYPNIKVLAKDTANWNRDEAVNRVNNWITAFGTKINGVVSENDDMALGAVQALKEAKRTDVKVVGIDGIEDGLKAVEKGEFIGTYLQNGTVQLSAGLAYAAQLANKTAEKKTLTYTMPAITTTNVGEAMKHVVTARAAFLAKIPQLTKDNMVSGNIANEALTGQTK